VRQEFVTALCDVARRDERLVFLTADLGFGVVEAFRDEFPARFFNVGVAEQAMVGMATGLASEGMVPYCYSIAPFVALRAFEFVRNGPVVHGLPVRLVGIGAGMDYGPDGISHYAIDDLAVMRCQPGLLTWSPADGTEITKDLPDIHRYSGPAYIRLTRRSTPTSLPRLHDSAVADAIISSADVLIVCPGDSVARAEQLAARLGAAAISHRTLIVSRFDSETPPGIARAAREAKVIVAVEHHYRVGGLYSLVAETVADLALPVSVVADGVHSLPIGTFGSREYMERQFMAPLDDIANEVRRRLDAAR